MKNWPIRTCSIGGLLLLLAMAMGKPDSKPSSKVRFGETVAARAKQIVEDATIYKETYETLKFPGGDVPKEYGVCTDMVIRSFRAAGVDLQATLNADRKANPSAYPTELWQYKKPDKSIDHRRCQNLVVYFRRHAESLTKLLDGKAREDWQAGDVVFFIREKAAHPWHVGIVTGKRDSSGRPTMYHLFPPHASEAPIDRYAPIHSHYRWKVETPSDEKSNVEKSDRK